jgi:hypothetical protein
MLGHDQRLERTAAVARDVDSERAGVGDERLAARSVAMVGNLGGLVFARRIAQVGLDPSSSLSIESTSRLNSHLLELLIDPATRESDKTAVAGKPPLNS